MEAPAIFIVSLSVIVAMVPAAFVWYVSIGGVFMASRNRWSKRALKDAFSGIACSVDEECPEGYRCIGGRCMPIK